MSKPRVALVFPYTIEKHSFFGMVLPSLGLERLGAEIEDVATVELFDARFESSVVSAVSGFNPHIVAISVKTTMYSSVSYAVADELRRLLPDATFVMGGLHASSCPEEALTHVDYVIRGDGEIAFRELVLGSDVRQIRGLAYRPRTQSQELGILF